MSVDFLTCDSCEDNFCDCGHYVSCECGKHWCSDECANDDGYEKQEECEDDCDECELENCTNSDESSCKYCRGEDYDDYELLQYVLKVHYGDSRSKLIEEYGLNKFK